MKEALSVEDTLKLALEAIEFVHDTGDTQTFDMCYAKPALAAIKEALAQPEQEPVAWITPDGEGFRIRFSPPVNDVPLGWDALYTTPPQRAWVGLTHDEVNQFAAGCHLGKSVQGAIYEAEAKLKDKNTRRTHDKSM